MAIVRNKSPEWTAERDQRVITLWPSTLTCQEIAAEIGGFQDMVDKGRTAVSARAHFLGLPPRAAGSKPKGGYLPSASLEPKIYRPGIDPRPKFQP